jgi:hypothetical protein
MPLLVHIPPAPPTALLTPSATRAVKWQKKPPDRSGSTAHTLDDRLEGAKILGSPRIPDDTPVTTTQPED